MDATSFDNFRDVQTSAGITPPRWRLGVRVFAPVYFFAFSILRCYIESELLARESYFSFYTALHHTLWNAATILMIILVVHLVVKVPIIRLLWLMYGITLMAIPLLYAILAGQNLQLEYLKGSFTEIVGHIVTFCFLHPVNKPLSIEIMVIFLSMLALGYGYTRSWHRAVILAAAVHLLGNMFAIHWIGPVPYARSVVVVTSQLGHHQFMSSVWLFVLTALTLMLVWRAGWFSGSKRLWLKLFLWTLSVWGGFAAVIQKTGWFVQPFDIFISGLMPATLTFLFAAALSPERRLFPKTTWAAFGLVLMLQLTVMGPFYLHEEAWFFSRPALPEWLVPAK